MSDCRETSSHSMKVSRKLSTMMPTPTVAETATMSAAMATEVRLRAPETERVAMVPMMPNTLFMSGPARRSRATLRAGVRRANPMMMEKKAACATTMPSRERARRPAPSTRKQSPRRDHRGRERRTRDSMDERASTAPGGDVAASRAGRRVESRVAPRPMARPFARERYSISTSRTLSTK
jgi:hypothetical protein